MVTPSSATSASGSWEIQDNLPIGACCPDPGSTTHVASYSSIIHRLSRGVTRSTRCHTACPASRSGVQSIRLALGMPAPGHSCRRSNFLNMGCRFPQEDGVGQRAFNLDTCAPLGDHLLIYHVNTPCWDRGNSTGLSIFPSRAYALYSHSIGVAYGPGTSWGSRESPLYRQARRWVNL